MIYTFEGVQFIFFIIFLHLKFTMQERRSVQKSFIFKYKIMSYRDFTINIIIQKFTLCNIWLNFCLPVYAHKM
jgi:hypothetical protein